MNEFEKRHKQEIAKRCEDIPRRFQAQYLRAMEGNSLRAAINSGCLDCIGWKTKEVRHCSNRLCPLYMVRPYQTCSRNNRDGHSGDAEQPKQMHVAGGYRNERKHKSEEQNAQKGDDGNE